MADIGSILKSSGVALEQQAVKSFGSAVEDFARGTLGFSASSAGNGIGEPGFGVTNPRTDRSPKIWDASSYASSLAGATTVRPKLKFLFKVQFLFKPEVISQYPFLQRNDFTFMIRQVDRPKVDFEYEDDVNLYNFRTKALKKIRHRELTMTFMDDVGNNVFDFFRTLMFVYSPVTRGAEARDGDVISLPNTAKFQQGSGMDFTQREFNAHRGVINSNAGNAIEVIRIKQIFVDPSQTPGTKDSAVKAVFYDFCNPRLVSFDLDDLAHEASEVNILTMQFDYDWLEMTKHDKLLVTGDGGPIQYFPAPSRTGNTYTGAPTDLLRGNQGANETAAARASASGSPQGNNNPFINILSNTAQRAAQSLTSDIANKAVRAVAGNGRFANSPFGRVITGGVSSAVGGVTSSVGGLVGASVRDGIGGLFSAVNQSTVRVSAPRMDDATTAGPDSVTVAQSSDAYNFRNGGNG